MFLTFFCAYLDDSLDIIDDRFKIALNYIQGWFIMDVISVFPFDQVVSSDQSSTLRYLKIARLYRLLRL